MKTKIFNSIFKSLLIFFLFLGTSNLYAQTSDTTIVKSMTINEGDVVYVQSSNFAISIQTWEKNEVNVQYDLFVEAESQKEVEDFLQAFNHFVDDRLHEKGKISISDYFKLVDRSNKKVKVRFEKGGATFHLKELNGVIIIKMPKSNPLNATSTFQELEIEDLTADATISVNSASFKMGNCRNLNLTSSFSRKMKIGNAESAKINVNSSDLKMGIVKTDLTLKGSFSDVEIAAIGNSATVNLNSSSFVTTNLKQLNFEGSFVRNFSVGNVDIAEVRLNSSEFKAKKINSLDVASASFSTFRIDDVGELQIKSSSSNKFYIENLSSLEAKTCSFSNFTIGQLKKRFVTSSNSGNINIENVLPGFDEIRIIGTFVTTDIHVTEGSNYNVRADFQFPNYRFKNVTYNKHDVDMSHETIEGWSGNKEKAISKIDLNCQSCKVTLD